MAVDEAGMDQRGLSRRRIIQASAVAGAAAWTAPVILDSLSSPAAAATNGPCTVFVYQINRTGSSTCTVVAHATCPTPATSNCAVYTGAAPTPAASACSGTGSVTFTVSGTCQIVATAVVNSGTAQPATIACPASTTLTDITPTQSVTLAVSVGNGKAGLVFFAVNGC